MDLSVLAQFLFSGVTMGSLYAVIAVGFTGIFNSSGVVNFAQGEFVMLGGLTTITLVNFGLPIPAAFICTLIIVALIGVLFERILINPRRRAPFFTLIVLTISAGYLIRGAARTTMGIYDLSLQPFIKGVLNLGEVVITKQSLLILGFTFLVAIGLWFFYNRTMLGKAMRAAKDNRVGAMIVGISPQTLVLFSWIFSATLGAAGGVFIAPISMMSYLSGQELIFPAIAAVTIGGFGSNIGAFIGGFIVGITSQLAAGLISPLFKDAITFLIIIIVLVWKPYGLFGKPTEAV